MKRERKDKPKLTDAERHKRFVDLAREVEASEDPKDFDEAFGKVVTPQPSHSSQKPKASHGSPSKAR
jgi:hypothetical protein